MPAFIAAAFLYGAIAGTVTAGVLAFSWAAFATTLVLGGLSRVLAKTPSPRDFVGGIDSRGRNITVRQPLAPWQIVMGEARVGGVLTYVFESSDNKMHLVITFAGHEVQQLGDVYFDDEIVPLDAAGAATGRYAGSVRVKKAKGDEAGSPLQPFPDLETETAGDWSSTHIQQGRAKLYARLGNSPDLFPAGIPNVSCVVRGLKVYDPRTSPGSTAWTHNPALLVAAYLTHATFGLGAVYADEIDEDTLIAAANSCEERVRLTGDTTTFTADAGTDALTLAANSRIPNTGDGIRVYGAGSPQSDNLPGGLAADTTYYAVRSSNATIKLATSYANAMADLTVNLSSAGSGTLTLVYYDEPRYTANGSFHVDEEPKAVLDKLLAAMSGKCVNVGGKWFIFAGVYEAPTLTFDEGDLAGAIRVQSLVSRRDSCNGVKGVFVDPSNAWQAIDFPAIASSAYMIEDSNERIWRDIDLTAFTMSPAMAQRLAKIELLRTRQGLTVSAPFKLSAFRAMTGRTVALTNAKFGWTAKAFDVNGSRLVVTADGIFGVQLELRETAAAIYDWSSSEEALVDVAPNTDLPDPWTCNPPPGSPAITFTQNTSVWDTATLSWVASPDSFINEYQVEYKLSTDSAWTVAGRTADISMAIVKLQPRQYDFRVKAINTMGVSSVYTDAITGTVVSALVTSAYTGAADQLGITTKVGEGTLSWPAASKDIFSMAFCPANNKIYGAVQDADPFSIAPDPVNADPSFSQILSGRRFIGSVYAPTARYMCFSQSILGSPTPAALVVVDPGDDSVLFESAVTGYEIDFLTYCPHDGFIWGSAASDGRVMLFDPSTGALVATIVTGGSPHYMAYCPTTQEMWVGDDASNAIFIVSLTGSPTHNVVSIAPGDWVRGIAYCSSEDSMVAAIRNTGLVFINPATRATTSTAAIGNLGAFTLYVPANDRLYVCDFSGSDKLYVVAPSTRNFYESNLHATGRFTEGCFCPLNNFIYIGQNVSEITVVST